MSTPTSTSPLASELAAVCGDLATVGIGTATGDHAKLRLLDTLGTIFGALDRPVMHAVRSFLVDSERVPAMYLAGASPAAQLLPPSEAPVSAANLGYLHGAAAFIDNYSDTSLRSVIHPNTVIVPAAVAASRRRPVLGESFLAAIIAGYQVSEVLGRMLNDGTPRMAHQVRGFRPTASCGPAGVAITFGMLSQLDQPLLAQAISLACNMAAGLRRTDAGELAHMRIHSGEATARGIEAVLMAQAGIRLDDRFLESPGGFLEAMSGGQRGTPQLHPSRSDDWLINDVAIKLHATPHTLAPTLDCLLELARQRPGVIEQVKEVRTFLPAAHASISLGAAQTDVRSLSAAEALDHLPFCASLVLKTAAVVLPTSPQPYIDDPEVLNLASRIKIIPDDAQSRLFNERPGSWPARLEIDLGSEQVEMIRTHPRGIDLSADGVPADLQRKYHAMADPILGADRADALAEFVDRIDQSQDVYAELRSILTD